MKHCIHEIHLALERCCFCGREGYQVIKSLEPDPKHGKHQPLVTKTSWKRIPKDQDCDARGK